MDLKLPLTKKWFDKTKKGIKPEDYRAITAYWCKRMLTVTEGGVFNWDSFFTKEVDAVKLVQVGLANNFFSIKKYQSNIMTLGYPKSTDTERIIKLEHKGIEIRTGKPEWGAEPEKIYLVVMHGKIY